MAVGLGTLGTMVVGLGTLEAMAIGLGTLEAMVVVLRTLGVVVIIMAALKLLSMSDIVVLKLEVRVNMAAPDKLEVVAKIVN